VKTMKLGTNRTITRTAPAAIALFLALLLHAPARAQEDPAGEWSPRYHEDQVERGPGPEIGDYTGLPLNDAARLRTDTWDASLMSLPENQCRPHGPEYEWRGPVGFRIWKEVDRSTQQLMAYHTHGSEFAVEQTIWMDGRLHPPEDAPHTWQGFSTGKWEGDTLVVLTTHLKENWIRRNGVMRSDLATLSSHIMRHGNYLTVAVVVYDPVYLTEPFMQTTDFVYAPQQSIAPFPCVVVEEGNNTSAATVPHHLPGANPYLKEFSENSGLPLESTRGGAETMYPEYQLKLKAMKAPAVPVKLAKNQ
jgi:hypothetical protein